MIFDENMVYTAINADKLEKGDAVIFFDSRRHLMKVLKGQNGDVGEIFEIDTDNHPSRFSDGRGHWWLYAYLIAKNNDPYKEFKKAQAEGKEVFWFDKNQNKWISNKESGGCGDWDFSDELSHYSLTKPDHWFVYANGDDFAINTFEDDFCLHSSFSREECEAWAEEHAFLLKEQEPKFRPYKDTGEMIEDFKARFKVNVPPYAKPLIWLKSKDNNFHTILIQEYRATLVVGEFLLEMKSLFDKYTYLDGSPCGKEIGE